MIQSCRPLIVMTREEPLLFFCIAGFAVAPNSKTWRGVDFVPKFSFVSLSYLLSCCHLWFPFLRLFRARRKSQLEQKGSTPGAKPP